MSDDQKANKMSNYKLYRADIFYTLPGKAETQAVVTFVNAISPEIARAYVSGGFDAQMVLQMGLVSVSHRIEIKESNIEELNEYKQKLLKEIESYDKNLNNKRSEVLPVKTAKTTREFFSPKAKKFNVN